MHLRCKTKSKPFAIYLSCSSAYKRREQKSGRSRPPPPFCLRAYVCMRLGSPSLNVLPFSCRLIPSPDAKPETQYCLSKMRQQTLATMKASASCSCGNAPLHTYLALRSALASISARSGRTFSSPASPLHCSIGCRSKRPPPSAAMHLIRSSPSLQQADTKTRLLDALRRAERQQQHKAKVCKFPTLKGAEIYEQSGFSALVLEVTITAEARWLNFRSIRIRKEGGTFAPVGLRRKDLIAPIFLPLRKRSSFMPLPSYAPLLDFFGCARAIVFHGAGLPRQMLSRSRAMSCHLAGRRRRNERRAPAPRPISLYATTCSGSGRGRRKPAKPNHFLLIRRCPEPR